MSQVQALPHDIMPEAGQLSLILICQGLGIRNAIDNASLLPLDSPEASDKGNKVMLCQPLYLHTAGGLCVCMSEGNQDVLGCIPHSACRSSH